MRELVLIGLVALAPFGLVMLPKWRTMIWGVMFLLVFEGALRKWVFPGLQAQIYILKDFILIAAYIGFFANGPRGKRFFHYQKGIIHLVILVTVFLTLQLANSNSPAFLLSVAGLKNYIIYFPLLYIVPHMFVSQADMERKIRLYAMIMVPVAVLGLVQFALGPSHWLNAYVAQDAGAVTTVSQFGGGIIRARTAGTFSYLSGYVTFLTAMIFLAVAVILGTGARIKGNYWIVTLLLFSSAAMFTTGSRMGVLSMLVAIPGVLLFSMVRGFMSPKIAIRSILAIVLVGGAIIYVAPEAIDAFASRANRVDDAQSRFLSPFVETANAFNVAPLFGTGLGSTHGGLVPIFVGRGTSFEWLNGHFFEVELARIMQETGIIGFLLYYTLRVACVVIAIRFAMAFKTRLYASLAIGIAGFFILHLVLFLVGNPTAAIYYWFGVGLLFAMRRLERKALVQHWQRNARQPMMAGMPQGVPSNMAVHSSLPQNPEIRKN